MAVLLPSSLTKICTLLLFHPTPSALLRSLSPLYTTAAVHTALKLVQIERDAPLAGIIAFRGARIVTLVPRWCLRRERAAVILADARPAEFWAPADLARGGSGVRVLSATGRKCMAVLTRRPAPRTTSTGEDFRGGARHITNKSFRQQALRNVRLACTKMSDVYRDERH